MKIVATFGLSMLAIPNVGIWPVAAQTETAPGHAGEGEIKHQSSDMEPASGNNAGANNGAGTQGSLDGGDAGKASSTVAGVNGGKTGFAAGPSNKSIGGVVESDPALGGGKQSK